MNISLQKKKKNNKIVTICQKHLMKHPILDSKAICANKSIIKYDYIQLAAFVKQ